jgi:hypothetical protein
MLMHSSKLESINIACIIHSQHHATPMTFWFHYRTLEKECTQCTDIHTASGLV